MTQRAQTGQTGQEIGGPLGAGARALVSDPTHGLDGALRLERTGDTFQGSVEQSWLQGRTAFGGLVAGALLRALSADSPPDRSARTLLIDFAGPVSAGTFEVAPRLLRSGKNLTHSTAELRQDGKLCATMTAVFTKPRSSTLHIPTQRAAPRSAPHDHPPAPYFEGVFPRFMQHFEMRWSSENYPYTSSPEASIRGYVRPKQPAHIDAAAVLAILDAWPPTVLPMLKMPAPASTVTWTVDFACELASQPPPDAFY